MGQGRIVMGLLFFPRGGSAYVVRYLSPALTRSGWSVSIAVGSLMGVDRPLVVREDGSEPLAGQHLVPQDLESYA